MIASAPQDPPGLDLARLSDWFAASVPGAAGDLTARLIAGGKSNLTYEVGDGRKTWIVRRPPLGHVLSTAHDMAREYRVMSALQATDVPVPTTYAHCTDVDVLGAPFYVMQRVAGTAYRHAAELERLGPERTRVISARLVDTLAALHAVDPAWGWPTSADPRASWLGR
jgi:aminoglycoside phosphotransferase (APT) family kinase protein